MVPVYSPTGKLLCSIELSRLVAMRLCESMLIRNRRGQIRRVQLKALTAHVRPVLTQAGQVVEQHLGDGHYCWAMVGSRGRVV